MLPNTNSDLLKKFDVTTSTYRAFQSIISLKNYFVGGRTTRSPATTHPSTPDPTNWMKPLRASTSTRTSPSSTGSRKVLKRVNFCLAWEPTDAGSGWRTRPRMASTLRQRGASMPATTPARPGSGATTSTAKKC